MAQKRTARRAAAKPETATTARPKRSRRRKAEEDPEVEEPEVAGDDDDEEDAPPPRRPRRPAAAAAVDDDDDDEATDSDDEPVPVPAPSRSRRRKPEPDPEPDPEDDAGDDDEETAVAVAGGGLKRGDFGFKGEGSGDVALPDGVGEVMAVPEGADAYKAYTRVRFPSGNSGETAWSFPIPGKPGEFMLGDDVEGVIVAVSYPRNLNVEKYDSRNPKAPLCSSRDGIIGHSDPGQEDVAIEFEIEGAHACGRNYCRFAQFRGVTIGKDNHKCMPRIALWVMEPEATDPILVPIPTTRMKYFNRYKEEMGGLDQIWRGPTIIRTNEFKDDDGAIIPMFELNEEVGLFDEETAARIQVIRDDVIQELTAGEEGVIGELQYQSEEVKVAREKATW